MTKLLFQSDDYGISDGVTDGIIKGIEDGIIRNTGLFVNMPSSIRAAKRIKPFLNDISLGIDINLVAGNSVSDPKLVKDLVDSKGHLISSRERILNGKIVTRKGLVLEYEEDPYPFDQVLLETENQLLKFKELIGKWPDYFHGHSLMTPNTIKAAKIIADKYGVLMSTKVMESPNVYSIPCDWTPKPFPLVDQINTNVELNLINSLKASLNHELLYFICHCGYVDADLMAETSYTMIRIKDLQAATSPLVKEFIKENKIELVTYKEIEEKL
ncbi:MAG: ChbG/HpnK family deacetylase [Erysipelotrichaceae bacterium]|nr:ChbG/HpnK family deacetylase [Erysipelotrichaceae bacterium]